MSISVDQMSNQVEALPLYLFFAGMVKMKLLELVAVFANCDKASPIEIELDRVSIINYP